MDIERVQIKNPCPLCGGDGEINYFQLPDKNKVRQLARIYRKKNIPLKQLAVSLHTVGISERTFYRWIK